MRKHRCGECGPTVFTVLPEGDWNAVQRHAAGRWEEEHRQAVHDGDPEVGFETDPSPLHDR